MNLVSIGVPRKLPCFPCPHKGACCQYGASVTGDEAAAILAAHGAAALAPVTADSDPEDLLRTAVVEGQGCVFLVDGLCSIHDQAYYPKTCSGFPWTDESGNPYLYDKTICPEFKD